MSKKQDFCPVCGCELEEFCRLFACNNKKCVMYPRVLSMAELTQFRAQLAERYGDAALKALVDRLPKTADGKPMFPGMDVWELRASGEIRKCWVFTVGSESAEARCGWGSPDPAWYRCYSTEAAAKKAWNRQAEKGEK